VIVMLKARSVFKCGQCSWSGSYLKTLVDQSQSPPSTGLQTLCWMTDSMPEKRIKNVIFHFYHMKAAQASFCNHKHYHREDCVAFMCFSLDSAVFYTDTFWSVYVKINVNYWSSYYYEHYNKMANITLI